MAKDNLIIKDKEGKEIEIELDPFYEMEKAFRILGSAVGKIMGEALGK